MSSQTHPPHHEQVLHRLAGALHLKTYREPEGVAATWMYRRQRALIALPAGVGPLVYRLEWWRATEGIYAAWALLDDGRPKDGGTFDPVAAQRHLMRPHDPWPSRLAAYAMLTYLGRT